MDEWEIEMDFLNEPDDDEKPWKEEVAEVLVCAGAEEILEEFKACLGELTPLGEEGSEEMNLVFANLIEGCDGDIMAAFWVAFWMGAAWQRICEMRSA
ncbi:MAG: hypothetical protein ACOC58_00250 [Chloroflexota bacterium]